MTEARTQDEPVQIDQSLAMAERRFRKASARLTGAQEDLDDAEREYGEAQRELEALEKARG